jgi:hypothetical protein
MAHSVVFDECDKIVVVVASSESGQTERDINRDKARCLCLEKGCLRILVDLRDYVTSRATANYYAYGEYLAQCFPGMRLAHVLPKDPKSRENVRFALNVAANRGLVTREFECINEARKWLLDLREADEHRH